MAPNRKKKKPASNPARGFATTSTISKARINDDAATLEADLAPAAIRDESNSNTAQAPTELQNPHRDLSELTPEELERQLEDSELQLLVEKYSEKVNKDITRQVGRLETERRLLRIQAEKLNTSWFLPDELMLVITDHLKTYLGRAVSCISHEAKSRLILSGEDLSIKSWTLRRTLSNLGFTDKKAHQAVSYLLHNRHIREQANVNVSKDSLWGLDQCLDWLALMCNTDEVPDYEAYLTRAKEGKTTSDTTPSVSGMMTPNDNPVGSTDDQGDSSVDTGNKSTPDIVSDSDDEVEPQDFLSRFLELQTRLFKRQPDLTLTDQRRTKGSRAKKLQGPPPIRCSDPASERLLRRIRKLQSDMLFDKEEACEKWAEVRLNLVKEEAERKKLHIEKKDELSFGDYDDSPRTSGSTDSTDDEDSLTKLGDFLASLPETKFDNDTGTSSVVTTNHDGGSVSIRDFGKYQGLPPRRILSEACKARDPLAVVSYKTTSTSNFSSRQSLIIRWSRDQELPIPSPIPAVTCEANSRAVRVDMTTVSTPDAVQSEAFISTVALFLIFSSSPKEEKAYLRLPSTWKDLWGEFSDARKAVVDASDREELREIRNLVETSNLVLSTQASPTKIAELENRPKTDLEANVSKPTAGEGIADSATLIALWKAKTSTNSYQSMVKSRMLLPIWKFKDELLTAIEDHQVVIVCGETGCGKSTQVPAFILENELSNGRYCKVYCTEPRRISAISLARRVSEELGERKNDVGTSRSLVGYAIRLESQITAETKLVYATTGIVMRMLERSDDLGDITHLVLDEVHERTIDSDFLLIVLRKLMNRRPGLKVILMSATVNAEQFSRYLNGAPIMNVPGRTFPVETRYLEDAIEATRYGRDHGSSNSHTQEDDDDHDDETDRVKKSDMVMDLKGYSLKTRNTLAQFDEYRIDYELIVCLLETIAKQHSYAAYSKAILVFLPGIAEIRRLNDMLAGHPAFSHAWYIYPLHSTIATEEQERAFLVPPQGVRKIVLATNIAETGITIPDVTCVIDTGKHKEMRFDERRQLSRLIESFISRANAKQRRGRAGRVQNGLCFHLFTKFRHDNIMAEQQTPEMLRLSLQDLVLRVKICKLGGIEQTMAEALDPPLLKNIRRAVESLIDVKALTSGEDLTPLGRQLAKLPLDVFLGKLIILGSLFRCLDATLTIAAIIFSKSPFSAPMASRAQADLARLAFKKGDSDLLTVYNAYCAWRRVCTTTGSSEYQFCRKNFLSPQTLSNIEDLKAQLTTSLVEAGFLLLGESEKAALNKARFYSRQRHFVEIPKDYDANVNDLVINSTIAWSFYPKLIVRDGKGWRNVANNQSVSLYPTSVNKGITNPSKYLSYYHIMQSSNKFYNAHETSPASDFAIALVCGDADFKMYSGVIVIDGNRLRFSVANWKVMVVMKALRTKLREIMIQSFRTPGKKMNEEQEFWWEIWREIFTRESE